MTNEAAERLNRWAPNRDRDSREYLLFLQTKREALAAERRATVERLMKHMEKPTTAVVEEPHLFYVIERRYVDEEAAL